MNQYLGSENKILCPYDQSHNIRRGRMGVHIVKCRKARGDQPMTTCEFNVTHSIPVIEKQYHHGICPDRKTVEEAVAYGMTLGTNEQYPIETSPVDTTEIWDSVEDQSYKPEKTLENRDVLLRLDVESAAKKRNFRAGQRLKLNQGVEEQPQTVTKPKSGPSSVLAESNKAQNGNKTIKGVEGKTVPPEKLKEKLKTGQKVVFNRPT